MGIRTITTEVWDGEGLPPVGCDVLFNTASSGDKVGTVTHYEVQPPIGLTPQQAEYHYRIFVHLVYKGTDTPNARHLCDLKPLREVVHVLG